MEQTINYTTYAVVAFLVFMIGLLMFHFLYKVPKDNKENNKPVIDVTKRYWERCTDEQFNSN